MSNADSEDLHALATPEQSARLRRAWRLQHLGWAIIAAIVLAGAIGLFGSGPFSSTTRSAQGLSLEFDRFVRYQSPFTLRIDIPVPAGSSQAELSLPRSYFDAIQIESMLPTPVQVLTEADAVSFLFAVVPSATSLSVSIHAEPTGVGLLRGELVAGGRSLPFTQLAWP